MVAAALLLLFAPAGRFKRVATRKEADLPDANKWFA